MCGDELDAENLKSVLKICREAGDTVNFWSGKMDALAGIFEMKGIHVPLIQSVPSELEFFVLLKRLLEKFGPAFEEEEDECMKLLKECVQQLRVVGVTESMLCKLMAEIAKEKLEAKVQSFAGCWEDACLEALLSWLEDHLTKLVRHVVKELDMSTLYCELLVSFIDTRKKELFDIIVGFPEETTEAVNDLKSAVDLLTKEGKGKMVPEYHSTLMLSQKDRLLHPGANTSDIIHTYMLSIQVLRILDPSGVTLDKVAAPIRKYLVQRSDTIRCIVQSLTDPNGDLFAELSKTEKVVNDEEDPSKWTPAPADGLPQSDGVSKNKDIVDLLINIFGGSEPFVNEFKTLLGHRLLAVTDYNVDTDIRNLELLKLRFGESSLHDCEIMLRDMADSKRINKFIQSLPNKHELVSCVNGTIISHLYWPSLQSYDPSFKPAQVITDVLKSYQESYTELKATRKLQWNMNYGETSIEVEMPSKKVQTFESVSFLQLTVLECFQSKGQWSLEGLHEKLEVSSSKDSVKRALMFWCSSGVIREAEGGLFSLIKADEEEGRNEGAMEDDMMMIDSDEGDDDDWEMVEPFISHMLTNLGSLSLQQIHEQLSNFIADMYNHDINELREYLKTMVQEEKLVLKDGLYSQPPT